MGRRAPGLVLILTAAVLAADDWESLGKEWHKSLARYDQALARAGSARARRRVAHPFGKYARRLRKYVREHANTPANAPALVEILRFTPSSDERHRIMVHLRENHLRSSYLIGAVDALTRIGDDEARRTLRDIAERHPDNVTRDAASRGLYELGYLHPGKYAPEVSGPAHAGGNVTLTAQRGKIVVLVFCTEEQETWRKERDLAEHWTGPPAVVLDVSRTWKHADAIARRWNASGRPRVWVIDQKGVISAKDVWGDALVARVKSLVK